MKENRNRQRQRKGQNTNKLTHTQTHTQYIKIEHDSHEYFDDSDDLTLSERVSSKRFWRNMRELQVHFKFIESYRFNLHTYCWWHNAIDMFHAFVRRLSAIFCAWECQQKTIKSRQYHIGSMCTIQCNCTSRPYPPYFGSRHLHSQAEKSRAAFIPKSTHFHSMLYDRCISLLKPPFAAQCHLTLMNDQSRFTTLFASYRKKGQRQPTHKITCIRIWL